MTHKEDSEAFKQLLKKHPDMIGPAIDGLNLIDDDEARDLIKEIKENQVEIRLRQQQN